MKRRTAVRIISFCIAAVAVCAGYAYKAKSETEKYKTELENNYSKNFEDLQTSIDNISLTLEKTRFATGSEELSNMAADLICEAEISKNAIAMLPNGNELNSLNKFLSQVGNYAMSVSRNFISNPDTVTKADENIEKMAKASQKIAQAVATSKLSFNNPEYWSKELNKKLDGVLSDNTLLASFEKLEDELTDLPTLIYDGPFSDHIFEKEPEMIKNLNKVTEDDALTNAAKALNCDKSSLKLDAVSEGKIPAYRFSSTGVTVSISQNGGMPVYFRKERIPESGKLSYEQALLKAKRYLEQQELYGFKETYYSINEDICLINFAYVDGETICYTDLIKVGVALDNGEIMMYEASAYLTNHRERYFETPVYSAEQAQALLKENLTVQSICLALIPTNSVNEKRCYEFACVSNDGKEVLVYINVLTLKQENILILLKSDGGILVK